MPTSGAKCLWKMISGLWRIREMVFQAEKKINAKALKLYLRMHVSRVSGAWWTRGDGVRRLEIIRRSHVGFCFLSLLLKTKSNMPPGNLMRTDDLWESLWCWERLRAKEKRASEAEMAGWHHWCSEHEPGQTPGSGEGQGGLVCCSPWSCKESGLTGRLNNSKCWILLARVRGKILF